jgi:hypothetical protein
MGIIDPFEQAATARANVAALSADAGIYSVEQAATILKCEPIQIQRQIAKRGIKAEAAPTPDSTASRRKYTWTILRDSITAYIKTGTFDLYGQPLDPGWFNDTQSYYAAERFSGNLADAAAADIPSDAVLAAKFAEQLRTGGGGPLQNSWLDWDLAGSPSLRAVAAAKTADRYGTAGMRYVSQKLRDATYMEMRKGEPLAHPGENLLTALYDSPSRFDSIVAAGMDFMIAQWNAFSLSKSVVFQSAGVGRGIAAPTSFQVSFSMSMKRFVDLYIDRKELIQAAF